MPLNNTPLPSGSGSGKLPLPVIFNTDGTVGQVLRLGAGGALQESDGSPIGSGEAAAAVAAAATREALALSGASVNVTVPAGSRVHTAEVVVSGAAGNRDVVLLAPPAPQSPGTVVRIDYAFPTTAGLVIRLRNATIGGTILATVTSDATGRPAHVEATWSGTQWDHDVTLYPSNAPLAPVATSGDAADLTGTLDADRIADGSLSIAKTSGLQTTLDAKASLASPNFTGSVTVGGTSVVLANDARLSDARTPLSHNHGNISNGGAIGSTANLPVVTTTGGALTTGTVGNGLTLSAGALGLTGQALALHNLASNGFVVRTSAGAVAARSFGVGVGGLGSWSNADGVAGNPSFTIAASTTAQALARSDTTTAMTPARVGEVVADATATRAADGYLWSDGATPNRAQIQTPGPRGNLAGAPLASWVGWVEVPTSNPSIFACISHVGASLTPPNPGDASSLMVMIETGGQLRVRQNNQNLSGAGLDRRVFDWAAFRSVFSGQRIWLEVRLSRGTSNPVVRINGADVSASFTLTTNATPPDWLASDLLASIHLSGFNWPLGNAPIGCWLNAHLTDAESEAWRLTGRPPAWVVAGGSMVGRQTSTFALTAGGGAVTSASATGFDAALSSFGVVSGANAFAGVPVGAIVEVRFTASLVSGDAPLLYLGFAQTSGWTSRASVGTHTVVNGANVARLTVQAPGGFLNFQPPATGVANFAVSNLTAVVIGALSLSGIQPIPVIDDVTTIGGNQARLVGMVPVVLQSQPVSHIERPAESYSAGVSVQILGGALSGSRKRRIVSISGNSSASTTISVGTSSGGTQLVNAQAVNGDFDIATFASRILPVNSPIWVTFAGATTASINTHLSDL